MSMTVHPQNRKSNFRKVYEAALRLPPEKQRRLRDELTKLSEVRLVAPAYSKSAKHEGQTMAAQVRAELAEGGTLKTLDETMQQLWGRAWSS